MKGIFKIRDTSGLPLEIIVKEIAAKGLVVAWDEYITDALLAGWNLKTIRRDLEEVLPESQYPKIVALIIQCWDKFKEASE